MFRVGEAGKLKGPGFLAFTKGMPVMLLHNTKTSSGLVNGMTANCREGNFRYRRTRYVSTRFYISYINPLKPLG